MSCYDQSGVNNIDLYENVGIDITYDTVSGAVTDLTTTGSIIQITNDLRPDYTNGVVTGANYDLMNNYNIKFFNFDLIDGRNQLNTLRNIFGWYVVVTFYSGDSYLINTPMFETGGSTLTSSATHTWELNLNSQVDTLGDLVQSFDTIPWILDTGFWNDSAIWKDTSIWID